MKERSSVVIKLRNKEEVCVKCVVGDGTQEVLFFLPEIKRINFINRK
jgi:hypothetical protein